MKKLIVLLITFNCTFLFAQTDKDILKNDIEKFIKANNESDYETLIEFFPEFVFDSISKNEVLIELNEFYSQDTQSQIIMDTVFRIDTIMMIDSKKYARIYIPQKITMDFSELKNENGMDYAMATAYKSFILEYGEENIIFKEDEWIFNITSNNPFYGIQNDNGWTFTELDIETEKYIPIEIREAQN